MGLNDNSGQSAKKRYLISPKSGMGAGSVETSESLQRLVSQDDIQHVRTTPTGRVVVEMTTEKAGQVAQVNPHLVVEEDQQLKLS